MGEGDSKGGAVVVPRRATVNGTNQVEVKPSDCENNYNSLVIVTLSRQTTVHKKSPMGIIYLVMNGAAGGPPLVDLLIPALFKV